MILQKNLGKDATSECVDVQQLCAQKKKKTPVTLQTDNPSSVPHSPRYFGDKLIEKLVVSVTICIYKCFLSSGIIISDINTTVNRTFIAAV